MKKEYSFKKNQYFVQVTLTGIFTIFIVLACIYLMLFTAPYRMLFAFIALIAGYSSWNTFISRSNPQKVILEEDSISFESYGKKDKYLFKGITEFRAKDFRGSGKIFIRVNNSNMLTGRYWIHTKEMNDSDELFLYLLKLEHQTHPDSIKARAWNSTKPGEDKTPRLPWNLDAGSERSTQLDLKELVEMSNRYGKNEELVLAGGGNTSYKEDNIMYVKGSGTALANASAENFVKMDKNLLVGMLSEPFPEDESAREAKALEGMMNAKLSGDARDSVRPSVECILHAIFPDKYVLHLHPSIVNALSCSKEGKKFTLEVLGEDIAWVVRAKPGYLLSKACYDSVTDFEKRHNKMPKIAVLQNHGIVVCGDSIAELDERMDWVVETVKKHIKQFPDFTPVNPDADIKKITAEIAGLFVQETGQEAFVEFESNKEVLNFASSKEALKPLMMPFTPDHIVYCKGTPLYVENAENLAGDLAAFKKEYDYIPKIIVIKNVGFFTVSATQKDSVNARLLFLDAIKIAVYTSSFGGPDTLDSNMVHFMMYWEFESYRLNVGEQE